MKTFSDTSFFLLFDRLLRKSRPETSPDTWTMGDVTWRRSRHSFEAQHHGFTIEVFEIDRPAKEGWCLMIVKESWWAGRNGETVRSAHWAKPLRGKRQTILAWLKAQEKSLEKA